jgi:ATP-dependent phosphofructokinase / diphosphate-dependent phosphofructokinase
MSAAKRIGILTSGGDCAGLNAVIRAVVHRAAGRGWQVIGIEEGTHGLLRRPPHIRELKLEQFDGTLLRRAGTILGTTNHGDPFAFPMPDGSIEDRSEEVIQGYRSLELDALIGVGGDGSQLILRRLAQQGGIDLVCIPKTIDNDIGATEVSVGYDTAVHVATEALDRLQPTAASHNRIMILEVMGRDAGHIALAAGVAGGADVILVPEIPYNLALVAEKIKELSTRGRNFALVVVAEATPLADVGAVGTKTGDGDMRYGGVGHYLGERLATMTDAEIRVTVLGHVQRGGMPDARDRLIASVFGVHAVDLIAEGKFDRMVAWRNREVVDVPITDAIAAFCAVDVEGALVRTARGLGISFGD